MLDPFEEMRSIMPKPAIKRTLIIVTSRKPMSEDIKLEGKKEDSDKIEKEGSVNLPLALATTYGLYKLSALEYIKNKSEDHSLVPDVIAILENYV